MKNNRAIPSRTSLTALLCLVLTLAFGPATAAAFDNEIHLLPSPPITRDAQGGYTFLVFGDTRTAQDDSKPSDAAFHKIRNMTHAQVVNDLTTGNASFALFTGDMIYRGSATPYWQEVRDQLPADLRTPPSPRLFPVLGNHELWQKDGEGDALANFYGTFPHLAPGGEQLHNYAFVVGDTLFVNLCSGGYGKVARPDRVWTCDVIESFPKLMASLVALYQQQSADGQAVRTLVVTYHKPSYTTYEHAPLDADNDPVETLCQLQQGNPGLKVFVFNGHNHVTELFQPAPGLFALVAGGGGAPQKTGVPVDDHGKPMQELFWEAVGSERTRRVNYFRVQVGSDTGQVTVEERALCKDGTKLDYFQGVGIDSAGTISYPGPRTVDCVVDDFLKLVTR